MPSGMACSIKMNKGKTMSLNDPRWGNNDPEDDDERDKRRRRDNEQGPPDLEEIWNDFNQKLGNIFGDKRAGGQRRPFNGGGGGSGGDGPKLPVPSFRQFSGGFGILVILLLLVWAASGFYIVNANERGVVLRFGDFVSTSEPGLRWRLPFPIETHEIVDLTGVRTVEIGYRGAERNRILREALMLTDDENIINIQFAVQYVLKSPEDYLFNNRFPDETVGQVAESAMREIVGRSTMDFALYEGREEIAAQAQTLMQQILDRYSTGVQVSRVTLQNAQPPEQVQAAFDDAVKAGQDRERQKNEGEAYANDVIPRARGTADRLLEEAAAYRDRVVAAAEGEASRFNQIREQYAVNPSVTRERLYIETMQQVMSNASKVMIDTQNSNNMMFLPLDRILQQSGASAGMGASGMGGGASPPTPGVSPTTGTNAVFPQSSRTDDNLTFDPRSRDFSRLRERGDR